MNMKEIQHYSQNRELSWLSFNERVLDEAYDVTVPLLERMKFVSIFTSNLDEFFMIRVGSLYDMATLGVDSKDSRTGWTPKEQLARIYKTVPALNEKRNHIYHQLRNELMDHGICNLKPSELGDEDKKFLKKYFVEQVLPMLSPQIVDPNHPFPHLRNKSIYVVANLQRKNNVRMGIVPVAASLPAIVPLPGEGIRYVPMEWVIMEYMDKIFDQYTVSDVNCISVTRNADISPDDESIDTDSDFRFHMKKILHRRRKMAIVRLEIRQPLDSRIQEVLEKQCNIYKEQIFVNTAPMKMGYIFGLIGQVSNQQKHLVYPPFAPQRPLAVPQDKMMELVKSKDLLMHFPYETMDPFLQMVKQASRDPKVAAIKITIYRLANKARLVEYLCAAAENGKEVVVLIELRARFDEQNNIDWSERLEEAGCRILYGFEAYKVHSKVCLIISQGEHGVEYITQIGTGNYNENTAKLYTDLSLITADQAIGSDAAAFFNNMSMGSLDGVYNHLLVAPNSMKSNLIKMIGEEAAKGNQGSIVIKCNSVTDCDMMEALSKASRAGAKVELIIRGICCIVPGIPGYTDKVAVTSLVGRYLEHARIYAFGTGDDRKMYIGSADMMTRNTERRVEVLTPVYDKDLKIE
ncbi:MAG: polyphosphate kinase 1, partial [Eubacteriales bacterium]